MRHIYRGEIGEIKWRNARMSCAYALNTTFVFVQSIMRVSSSQ